MKCPKCNHPKTKVISSKVTYGGLVTTRRHECPNCGHRATSYEAYASTTGRWHWEVGATNCKTFDHDFEI